MRKFLVLFFVMALVASFASAGVVFYSYTTGAGNVATGNQVNGGIVFDPALNAVFAGQYVTGLTNRANILGFSADPLDVTYGTNTPKYFIRERMYGNGVKLIGLKSVHGAMAQYNGKLYSTSDYYTMGNLNFVPRTWCAVNADSVSITFPNVSIDYPLYNVTGVSFAASNIREDANGTPSIYLGTSVNTTTGTTDANGWNIVLADNNKALVGVTGVYTGYDSASTWGTNFYNAGGYSEPNRSLWCGTKAPGSTLVRVICTDGNFDPNTGVISINTTLDPGTLLFAHVGQLQPSVRGTWKWDATTLAAETGWGTFGVPAMFVESTVASKIMVGATTTLSVSVPSAYPITDQFLVTLQKGSDTSKERRAYASYGTFTVGPLTSADGKKIIIPLNGKPVSGITGVYTTAVVGSTNFWSRRAYTGWVSLTNTTNVVVPWGPIDRAQGVWTSENTTGQNYLTGAVGATEVLSIKGGGTGGWWNFSDVTPTIYFASGIDTSISGDSVYVKYDSPDPSQISPALLNVMDTTGEINLYNPVPAGASDIYVIYATGNGLDIAKNEVACAGHVASSTPLQAGDTVYVSLLYQGGTNPYNFTGAGTANNRSISWNHYGVAFDGAGNFAITPLFSNYAIRTYDSNGNQMATLPIKGARSTVTRGGISIDTTNGDIYWCDQGGIVVRFTKTGAGMDSYVQQDNPFFVGTILGGLVDYGTIPTLRVKTLPTITGGATTLVFLSTAKDANTGNTGGLGVITVVDRAGNIVQRVDMPAAITAHLRGIDLSNDGKQLFAGDWSAAAACGEVVIFNEVSGGPLPVSLSSFESIAE